MIYFAKSLSLNFFRDEFIISKKLVFECTLLDENELKDIARQIFDTSIPATNVNLDIVDMVSLFRNCIEIDKYLPDIMKKFQMVKKDITITPNDSLIVVIKDGKTKFLTAYLVKLREQ